MGKVVIVKLTPEQEAAVKCVMDEARTAAINGAPGIVAAQVFVDHMRVGFLPADKAEKISARMADGSLRRVRAADDC